MATILERLISAGPVIPVLNFRSPEEAAQVCQVLYDAGLRVFEITLRHESALKAIERLGGQLPEDALVGAGTILLPDQLRAAKAAGAVFGVSPGLSPELAKAARAENFPYVPGVATVSEAMAAQALGFSFQKFFPAEASGGAPFVKFLVTVLPDIRFCPTGGLNMRTAADYLALPNVPVVGGSWLVVQDEQGAVDLRTTKKRAINISSLNSRVD